MKLETSIVKEYVFI